MYIGV